METGTLWEGQSVHRKAVGGKWEPGWVWRRGTCRGVKAFAWMGACSGPWRVQECVGVHRRVVGAQVCGQPVRGTVSTKAWVWQVCVPMRSS